MLMQSKIQDLFDKSRHRFSNYQDLNSILRVYNLEANINYSQNQVGLDSFRYEWLTDIASEKLKNSSVFEIGGNLGYFGFHLCHDYKVNYLNFEPIEEYVEISMLIKDFVKLGQKFEARSKPLLLEDLINLPKVDFGICLNVLHHGGYVFDQEVAKKFGNWSRYASEYLAKLSEKTKYLFFQVGNSADGKALFEGKDAHFYITELLETSGWEVEYIGVNNQLPKFEYAKFNRADLNKIPKIGCRRNSDTNLVDYFQDEKLITSLQTGMAQRPLFFCRSLNGSLS